MKEISFKGNLVKLNGDVWHYGIEIPSQFLPDILQLKDKRLICRLSNSENLHCAAMPMGDGRYFILVNKEKRLKLGLKLGSQTGVTLRPDDSPYGMPMPEEMSELLNMDSKGDEIFHSLTPGKQRSLLFIISKPKSSDIRLKKALVVVEYLKKVHGKLDYKELNIAFKEANQKH